MRGIKYIGIHCTAGPLRQSTDEIRAYWLNVLGWKTVGYHYLISADGTVENLLSIEKVSNGVKGFNNELINICCKGGIDAGKPIDNRTDAQIASLTKLVRELKAKFSNAVVLGHRDFSTDANGNGLIDQWEFIKSCPAYDVRDWLKEAGLEDMAKPSGIVYKQNYPLIKDSFVAVIQNRLKNFGYKVTVDSLFGKETADALKEFQKKNKLPVTGIADNLTISVLGIR